MTNTIKYLWVLFLLTFPLSIRFLVYEQNSYRFGNFNPWVTEFVYLPEILLGLIFVLWIINKVRSSKFEVRSETRFIPIILLLFVVNAYLVTAVQGDLMLGAFFLLRLAEVFVVYLLITDEVLKLKQVVTILLFSAFVQVLWGYGQWTLNESVGLSLLGESKVGPDILNVAKNDLADGTKHIRAYGSFLHSNILAGYLLIVYFLSLPYLRYGHKLFFFGLFTWGLFLADSQAAMLVGLVGVALSFLFTVFRKVSLRRPFALLILTSLVVVNFWFFLNSSVVPTRDLGLQERLVQNEISHQLLRENPLGVGVRNYTLVMEKYTGCEPNSLRGSENPQAPKSEPNCVGTKLLPWEFQPVHNTYFLILNETGLQGFLLLSILIGFLFYRHWQYGKAIPLLILILLAPFDHFLWDSWVGFIMIGLVAGFYALENKHHLLSGASA